MAANNENPTERPGNRPDAAPHVRYPTNHVVAVIENEASLADAVSSLTQGGFLPSEINVSCGPKAADRIAESPGRGGLAGLAIRIAKKLHLEDDEMALKSSYEQAIRDGAYLVSVSAPSDERKSVAADILRQHDANSINFLGRFHIEVMDRA